MVKDNLRIMVYHSDFSAVAGGGEAMALRTVKALKELGYDAELSASFIDKNILMQSMKNIDLYIVPKILNLSNINIISSFFINKNILPSFWITYTYKKIYDNIADELAHLKHEYDLILCMQSPKPIMFGDVGYFHFPHFILPMQSIYIPNSLNPFVKLYKLFLILFEYKIFKMTYKELFPKIFISNSTWTKNGLIKIYSKLEALGFKELSEAAKGSYIIYPSIDYEILASTYDPNSKRDLVLTVSRYNPAKNLWSIIYVAHDIPEAHFIIAGTTKEKKSFKVLAELEYLIDKLRVKNVTLEKDVSRKRLVDLYKDAKVYLHPLYVEHFGISIAEGAAAGAVPVVYKDGGGWLDIASRIDSMLGYKTVKEAAGIVKTLLQNHELWQQLSRKAVILASTFSWSNFKYNLNNVIRYAVSIKRRPH